MTFAQRRNRLTTHFSERIPVVKRRISVLSCSRGSVASTASKLGAGRSVVRTSAKGKDYFFSPNVQTGSAYGSSFPGVERPRHGADHLPAPNTEVVWTRKLCRRKVRC